MPATLRANWCSFVVLTVFNGLERTYGRSLESNPGVTDGLCLRCGMCCDGTLFRDVELRPPDDRDALKRAGLEIHSFRRSSAGQSVVGQRFPQPCAALGLQCRCQVYADRPASCRAFECTVFQAVAAGRMSFTQAGRKIAKTRELAAQARRWLAELGDTEETLALAKRFQRMQRRFFAGQLPTNLDVNLAADRFGELAAVIGQLQLSLRLDFYPDAP